MSNLDRYFEWAERTRSLCRAGEEANAWIDRVYQDGRELRLFDEGEEQRELLVRMSERSRFWRSVPQERIQEWSKSSRSAIEGAIARGDRLALIRELAWLSLSTIPIAGGDRELVSLAVRAMSALPELSRGRSIHAEHRYEAPAGFVRRNGRQVFGTVYRIERPGEPMRFAEVVETWQLDPERITLCVPIWIGCANRCPMCEFGTYDGGPLAIDEIDRMIELNLANNRGAPLERADLTVYYLGGGDPMQHPQLEGLLRRGRGKQIVSTIAVGNEARFEALIDAVADTDAGLQVSLCSLDEKQRRMFVGNADVLPIERCLEGLARFHARTGRKGYVSLIPTDGDEAQIVERLDPRSIHVTLTLLRANRLRFTEQRVERALIDRLAKRLAAAGFEISVTTNDEDPENEVTCGRSDQLVLQRNLVFSKASHLRRHATTPTIDR